MKSPRKIGYSGQTPFAGHQWPIAISVTPSAVTGIQRRMTDFCDVSSSAGTVSDYCNCAIYCSLVDENSARRARSRCEGGDSTDCTVAASFSSNALSESLWAGDSDSENCPPGTSAMQLPAIRPRFHRSAGTTMTPLTNCHLKLDEHGAKLDAAVAMLTAQLTKMTAGISALEEKIIILLNRSEEDYRKGSVRPYPFSTVEDLMKYGKKYERIRLKPTFL